MYPDRVGSTDKAAVRPIVVQRRTEIESDLAVGIPCCSLVVVDDDESSARGDRVSKEIVGSAIDAVIRRDCGLVGVGSHQVESEFSLR
jgi:hypothetical protein